MVWYLLLAVQMIRELRSITRSDELQWWPLIVPLYNIYFMWLLVPQEVTKAKQMLGVRQPPQHLLLYIFLWPFALATDLNDMVRLGSRRRLTASGRAPRRQTLKRKCITSPSRTTYSLPSMASFPASRALLSPPSFTKSSHQMTSALMKPFSKSVWMTPAA